MQPTLSIVIPTHNRSRQLRCLTRRFRNLILERSAEAEVELIVVDDGSSEPLSTAELSGAILLRNTACQGAPAARKRGFQRSAGRYVHFHDSDDDISDGWLKGILERISTGPFDLLFTPRLARTTDNPAGTFQEPRILRSLLSQPLSLRNYLSYENCIGPLGAVTFSRRAAARMTFPALLSCQDWHMYWEALQEDSVLVYVPDIWHVYDRTGNNRISSSTDRKRAGLNGAAKLMCQSERKRLLVRFFLNLGYDVKMRQQIAFPMSALHAALRPVMLSLARHPALDRVLFGPPRAP